MPTEMQTAVPCHHGYSEKEFPFCFCFVILAILFLCKPPRGMLPILSARLSLMTDQHSFLNHLRMKNGHRNIFMTKSSQKACQSQETIAGPPRYNSLTLLTNEPPRGIANNVVAEQV